MTASIILGVLLFVNIILTSGIFKYYSIVVGSGSMHPAIQKGDLIIVEKIKKEHLDQINENDILVYLKEKQIIVHRVVNITYENSQYTFETEGDANEVKDPWVIDEKDVIGKVN
ncbi:MAG: signal peptidase I [Bacilli bacterium]